MNALIEILLAILLLVNLLLAGTGRLRAAIRFVAFQGVLVGLLPLLTGNWILALINVSVKGIALPTLLRYAAEKAQASYELEPLVSFRASQLIVFLLSAASFAVAKGLHVQEGQPMELAIPVAFAMMGTGLFLTCARRKAITQVLGFLTFENGITVFGSGLMIEYGLIAELGILLDVFVLAFVLGIAIYQIKRTFSSIDTDKLNHLHDR